MTKWAALLPILMLCGCATAPSLRAPIDLPLLPAKLVSVSCAPTVLPSGSLSRSQVEKLWARDRANLVRCGYSLGGLITFYEDLARRLRAAGQH